MVLPFRHIAQDISICPPQSSRGVGSTVACESALRSAGTLLSRVRAPLPAPWPDGGPKSLRSPCCGLAIYKKLKKKTPNRPTRSEAQTHRVQETTAASETVSLKVAS
ncbi:hypothetical protein PoB_006965900 [Plakobranchus ocellatus]|uniref:Uncharacterized protein n=1 Tax=Plakobranchus ocellatus TaxID=259542 RepID=A0AAV4DGK7_9GAST|nr:hypothetical protein PoB_006965900 [Plakobranchus ocellatus]